MATAAPPGPLRSALPPSEAGLGAARCARSPGHPGAVGLMLLSSEGASFCEARLAARGLAQHGGAAHAEHHGLRVAEHGGDLIAAWALDVHEVGVGALHQALLLVLALLLLRGGVQEVLGQL